MTNKIIVVPNNNDVININKDGYEIGATTRSKERIICNRLLKANLPQSGRKSGKTLMRCLFEAI